MCMFDDGVDIVNIVRDSMHVARKQHECGECGRTVTAGEKYRAEAGLLHGSFHFYKTCEHCLIARQWLSDNCDGWLYEGVKEDFEEHAKEYQRMDLCRVAVGMANQWTTRKGRRMPVPALPRPLHDDDAKALLR